jgi:hypothetical protein
MLVGGIKTRCRYHRQCSGALRSRECLRYMPVFKRAANRAISTLLLVALR